MGRTADLRVNLIGSATEVHSVTMALTNSSAATPICSPASLTIAPFKAGVTVCLAVGVTGAWRECRADLC